MARDIVKELTTPGTFVVVPSGKPGMVRSFNATSNECTVQFGATGFMDAMIKSIGRGQAQFESEMRDEGMLEDFHFDRLRLAPKEIVDRLTGQTP